MRDGEEGVKIKCGRNGMSKQRTKQREREEITSQENVIHPRTHKQAHTQHQYTRITSTLPLTSHRSGIEAGDGRHERRRKERRRRRRGRGLERKGMRRKGNRGAREMRARNTKNPCNSFQSTLIERKTLMGSWGGAGRWSRGRRGKESEEGRRRGN